jgi:hypothetical protein
VTCGKVGLKIWKSQTDSIVVFSFFILYTFNIILRFFCLIPSDRLDQFTDKDSLTNMTTDLCFFDGVAGAHLKVPNA